MKSESTTHKNANVTKSCFGYCKSCEKEHFLYEGNARRHCLELMNTLKEKGRIDLKNTDEKADPQFSTDYVFSKARGQMFGILECKNKKNDIILLRAFSGQYNGAWQINGWVPPLFNVQDFDDTVCDIDKMIKELNQKINSTSKTSVLRKELISHRKMLSQNLMKDIHNLYRVNNFRHETKSLYDIYSKGNGIPNGTGDCCAPKLLNYAAKNNLTPVSMAEFYWGKENKSGTRQHRKFYPSCEEKCQPILGFMLCGLEK